MKRIGFTCSSFDLLHAGHILMLQEAREQCDELWAGLQSDPTLDRPDKNKPVQSLYERAIQLAAVRYVNRIYIYDTEMDLLRLLKRLKPDVRIIGEDYRNQFFTGKLWCEDNGVEIYYNTRDHNYSTTELRQRVAKAQKHT